MKHEKLFAAALLALTSMSSAAMVFTTDAYIAPLDFTFDGQDITVTSCVLNINGAHHFASLTLLAGGVVTHLPAAPGPAVNRVSLSISLDVLIDPTSKIDVSEMGYSLGFMGPGAGVTGPPSADWGSGGGYGGYGADGSSGAPGGAAYGSMSQPTDWGSAGGACPSHLGDPPRGGGAVRLDVGGMLTVHGLILANGGSDADPVEREVGGGAGGSIWLSADVLAGVGAIEANGGAGDDDGDSGGGGGGRIALYYRKSLFTGRIEAHTSPCSFPGGAGTIYTKITGQTNASVLVNNGGNIGVGTGISSTETLWLTATNGGIASALSSLNLLGLQVATNSGVTCANAGSRLSLAVQGDALVAAGGAIQVDGKGYPVNLNQGAGTAPNFPYYAGGASYGGLGGAGWSQAPIGSVYGSFTQPLDFGSAGGTGFTSFATNAGSAGGGAMKLDILGALTLDGRISANGVSAAPGYGGCGSGGSIWLNVNTLQGRGVVTANGGSSPAECDGGSGGGGRVAIYYTNAPAFIFPGQVFALGGGPTICPSRIWGGAGTVYYQMASQPGELLIENGGNLGAMTPLVIPQALSLTVASNGVAELAAPPSAMGSLSEVDLTRLQIGAHGILTANSASLITVQGDAEIQTTGALNLDGKGYMAGVISGSGAAPATNDYAGGASYGGYGGLGWSGAPAGAPYGSLLTPIDLGSAGGAGEGEPGSAGGGALILNVAGALTLNGTISANGVSDNPGHGGSGSGGSVWLTTGGLQGSGSISANGGSGRVDCDGGGGGGGRIAIYYDTANFDFTKQVFARGGGPFACPKTLWGGAGTIYLKGASQTAGDLMIDNGGHQGALTPVTSPAPCALTVSGGAIASASYGLSLASLRIATNSALTDLPGDPSLDVLVLANAQLDAGSAITVDAHGYPVGANRGPGAATNSSSYAGGGGYGGPGGAGYYGSSGGVAYGSLSQPVDLGSAGGIGANEPGTAGGGAIRLTVAGALVHNGLISANGGSRPLTHGGCGSGGSIWLTASALSGIGLISAAGGTGLADCDGGSGGGGRIAIYSGSAIGFDFGRQVSAPPGGPAGCPTLIGSTGTVFTAPMTALPALAVLSSTPSGGQTRPWVDFIDLVFNLAVDPATFSSADVAVMTPSGLLPASQFTLSNLGGTRWRIAFPRQLAGGAYEFSVGPNLAGLNGTPMPAAYAGAFNISQTNAANRISFSRRNSTMRCSMPSSSGFNYQPLWSTNLVAWFPLGPATAGDDAVLSWNFPISTVGAAFFRIQITDAP